MTNDKLKALVKRLLTAHMLGVEAASDQGIKDYYAQLDAGLESAATVLRSALTPAPMTWEPLPRELPEGAVYGYYRNRSKKHRIASAPIRWDHRDVAEEREYWAKGELSVREFMLIAAFDANDNPVANGEVVG